MSTDSSLSRRSFLTAAGGAAAATVAGCVGEVQAQEEDPEEGGELRLINSTISSLDPIQSTDTASAVVLGQAYENLVHYPDGETELENQLAEEVEVSDDLLTYTFTLTDATYHGGEELTAADFEYAWRRLAESEHSQRANFLADSVMLGLEIEIAEDEDEGVGPLGAVPDSLGVEVVDDETLEITLTDPEPAALDILAYDSFGAIPEGFVGDLEDYEDEAEVTQEEFATETMNGTGPFEFEEWVPESEARVTRFEDYHGDPAYLDAVHWNIIEDDDAIWTVVNERNVDVFGIPTPFYEPGNVDAEADPDDEIEGRELGTYGPLENGDTVNYLAVPELSTFYFGFNARQVPAEVRQAIAYITDHSELIEVVFQERGEEAFTFTPPGMWPEEGEVPSYEEFVDEWPYGASETDREGAEQVLQDAGYTPDDPFDLTLTTYEDEAFQEAARLTRDKTAGLGVDLSIEEAPFGTLISRGEDGDLEMYTLGWIWSWIDPAYGHFGFEPENTNTELMPEEATGYYLDWQEEDSEAADQAQEAWETIEDNPDPEAEDVRMEAHVEIERAITDDMILLPLFHNLNERFWYDHVNIAPTGPLGDHRQQLHEAWLEDQ